MRPHLLGNEECPHLFPSNVPVYALSRSVCDNTPTNVPLNSAHPGGVNAVFADGSVRFLTDSTPLAVVAQLATRDDGIPLPQ